MSKLDAILLFSEHSPEPERAQWLASELCAGGLRVSCAEYEAVSGELIDNLYSDARHVIVLLSAASVQNAGRAFAEAQIRGRKPLPVRVDSHPKHVLMADLAHADITGNPADDKRQFDRLVEAVRAE